MPKKSMAEKAKEYVKGKIDKAVAPQIKGKVRDKNRMDYLDRLERGQSTDSNNS